MPTRPTPLQRQPRLNARVLSRKGDLMANLGMPDDIGEPIASRELTSPAGVVLAEFNRPQPWGDGQWICGFRITGLADEPEVLWLPGQDSLQALLAAIGFVGDLLAKSEQPLTLWGNPKLGFPVTEGDGIKIIRGSTEAERAATFGLSVTELRELHEQARQPKEE